MLEKYPKAVSWRIAELMKESQVADSERIPLLVKAASTGDAQQRLGAFWQLSKMKYPGTMNILIDRLNQLPSTPDGPYWTCEAAGLAMITQDLDDPKGWDALLRLAKRSDVGQRLEILHHLGHQRSEGARLRHRIEFISKFVEDTTLRVALERDPAALAKLDPKDWNKAKFDGPFADFDIKSITVQDAALRDVSHEVGIKEHPRSDWTKDEWSAWRNNAKKKLAEYLAKPGSALK